MAGIFDTLLGTPQPSRVGTLSSLATMPLNMPSLVPQMTFGSAQAQRSGGTVSPGVNPTTGALPLPGGVLPPAPVVDQPAPTDQHPGFFGQGGAAQTIAGILGDALLVGTNHAPMYAPIMAQRQQEASRARLQASQQAAELDRQKQLADYNRDHDRQVVNFGGGGIGQWDAHNGLTILRQPDAPEPKQTPLQQNLATLRALRPDLTDAHAADIVQRGMQGYQYDPTYMTQRQNNAVALADERGAQARATKGTPTYTNTHPKTPGGGSSGGAAGGLSTAAILAALGRK